MPDDKKPAKADPAKTAPDPVGADKPAAPPPTPNRPKRTTEPPAARVCNENERAGPGLTRFRVRAIDHDRPIGQYVVAPDRAAAEACYLKHERFVDLDENHRPALRVDELPD